MHQSRAPDLPQASGVSWKFAEGKDGDIESRQGNRHSKAETLRALLTLLTLLAPYRQDSRPSFDLQISYSPH